MKSLVVANQKGGVGKSFISCQVAYHLHQNQGQRILLIDLDNQGNTTSTMTRGGIATISSTMASKLFTDGIQSVENAGLLVISADRDELRTLEQKADRHNDFATNLKRSLKAIGSQFDLCIIDVAPTADIRQLAALVVVDYLTIPCQLAEESIKGIGLVLYDEEVGVKKIQAKVNPKLKMLGVLPNMVEPTPYQRNNFIDLAANYGKLLIPMPGGGHASIKRSTAIFEAQAAGQPVYTIKKTSARQAWQQIEPVFNQLATMMQLEQSEPESAEA